MSTRGSAPCPYLSPSPGGWGKNLRSGVDRWVRVLYFGGMSKQTTRETRAKAYRVIDSGGKATGWTVRPLNPGKDYQSRTKKCEHKEETS